MDPSPAIFPERARQTAAFNLHRPAVSARSCVRICHIGPCVCSSLPDLIRQSMLIARMLGFADEIAAKCCSTRRLNMTEG